jgi:hypothetical protein
VLGETWPPSLALDNPKTDIVDIERLVMDDPSGSNVIGWYYLRGDKAAFVQGRDDSAGWQSVNRELHGKAAPEVMLDTKSAFAKKLLRTLKARSVDAEPCFTRPLAK